MAHYIAPVIQKPSQEEVKSLAQDLQLHIPDEDIPVYRDIVCGILSEYSVLEKYVEPVLPVKYPRTPGYRPSQEDNTYNAWYYKTEIVGAAEGPLKGYKVAIKDSIPVAGVPMMIGSRVMEGYVPDYDPTVITRLLDAGATIVGKATCEDMCYCGNSFTSHPSPVLNPHDVTRTAGGSSSGCAVVVQTGDADMALGGDQGGSIRMPSCWTGIVGLKPTYGLIPYTGIPSMTPAVDHTGPMTRTVRDCALMLQVLAGDDDGLDMRQRNIPPTEQIPKYSQLLCDNLGGMTIGLVTEGFTGCDKEVEKLVKDATKKLEQKGATVEEISIPLHKDALTIFRTTVLEGTYHNMVMAQGQSTGPPSYYTTSFIDNCFAAMKSKSRDIPESLKLVELVGKFVNDNYGMRFYGKSQNLLRMVRQTYNKVLDDYDVIVMPTIKYVADKLPARDCTLSERLGMSLNMTNNTSPFNGTGHPALSINAGYVQGLPVGMMIVGKHLDEQTLLNVAYAHENIRDG